jgi:hypothetical protein
MGLLPGETVTKARQDDETSGIVGSCSLVRRGGRMFIKSNGNEANDREGGRVDDDHGLDGPSDHDGPAADGPAADGPPYDHVSPDNGSTAPRRPGPSCCSDVLTDSRIGQLLPGGRVLLER